MIRKALLILSGLVFILSCDFEKFTGYEYKFEEEVYTGFAGRLILVYSNKNMEIK